MLYLNLRQLGALLATMGSRECRKERLGDMLIGRRKNIATPYRINLRFRLESPFVYF